MRERKPPERVFEWINRSRGALGKAPLKRWPKGVPNDYSDCLVARALGIDFDGDREKERANAEKLIAARVMTPDPHGALATPPQYIKDFIAAFDQGAYPDLIDSKETA